MLKLIKKDSLALGMVLGLLLPGVLFGILYLIVLWLSERYAGGRQLISNSSMGLVSIFLNMFLMRIYLVKWKLDKTGRGILVVTFVLAILFILLLFE